MKIAKVIDPVKIKELKGKIHDRRYLDSAVNRIAAILTDEMYTFIEDKDEK